MGTLRLIDRISITTTKTCPTSTAQGLTALEAMRLLSQDGPNELRAKPPIATWHRIVSQFQDPLTYLLLAASVVALGAWTLEGARGWPVDAIAIAAVVALNRVLGCAQHAKAQKAVAALARMTAVTSAVIRDGQLLRVPSATLVCGDLLVLAEGDAVGAEARLIESASLRIQEASLTGESEAVFKDVAALPLSPALGDQLNRVFKGTAVVEGKGRATVAARHGSPKSCALEEPVR